MKSGKRRYVALLAAVAATSLAALPAIGQVRVDTSGRAMDANNQIGAGGYNAAQTNQSLGSQYQNALVTNNVTNGAGFRGRTFNGVNLGVGYNDPFAFRGLLAGQGVDQFISQSTGVPSMSDPFASSGRTTNPPQVYYGASNNNAPAGFQQLPNGQGYIPAQPMTQTPFDTRLGTVDFNTGPILPKPNELLLSGPVDPTANVNPNANSQLFAASPLYGVRQWQFNGNQIQPNSSDQQGGQGSTLFGNQSPLQQGSGVAQYMQTPDQSRLMQVRRELNNPNGQNSPDNSQQGGTPGATLLAPLQPGTLANGGSGQPLQSLANNSSQMGSTNMSPQAGDFSTGQSSRQYLGNMPLPAPSQQSSQVALLEQMKQKYDSSHPKTDEQANADFQQLLRMHQQAATNAERGADVLGGPGNATGNETNPGVPNPDNGAGPGVIIHDENTKLPQPTFSANTGGTQNTPTAVAPVPIDSFASGIKAKDLADMIATGETLVEQSQYDRAIATYNDAIQVAPNNPLILTARANAELGGGYYAQAYTDLHTAVMQDPSVLIGRYDLQKHMGADHVNDLSNDLKQIALDTPKEPTHAFLYAYVLYNSHHIGMAAKWLDIADQRAGGKDPVITDMKKYWNFNFQSPGAPSPAAAGHPSTQPLAAIPKVPLKK
ncbi:MAG TPA: tetratricopeptide repeat protein [Tepidisphaeraceae bacterium]